MQVHSFIADSAADAVAQIRTQLGPEAIVLNVRKLPGEGLARLWQKPRIEVLAYLPEVPTPEPEPLAPAVDPLAELRQELAAIKHRVDTRDTARAPRTVIDGKPDESSSPAVFPNYLNGVEGQTLPASERAGQWRVGKYLENTGLLPLHVQRVMDQLCHRHGEKPPEYLADELKLARGVLSEFWPKTSPVGASRVHIFIGAAGVGKTTCVCKWLAQKVLVEGTSAHVWRLDGRTANTAESLSVYCEILGVPLDRIMPTTGVPMGAEILFIDLPGVNWSDAEAVRDLGRMLGELPPAQVHLVLNAAYEMPLLLAQVRAFAGLPVADLVFTHLDEETRWGKIWNFVLGTNYSVGFLSAGQNIPGSFLPATVENIISRQFPCQ